MSFMGINKEKQANTSLRWRSTNRGASDDLSLVCGTISERKWYMSKCIALWVILFLCFIENDFGPNRKINDHLHVCGHNLDTKSPLTKLLPNLNFMRYVVRSFSINIFWTDEAQGEGPSAISYTTLTLKSKQKLIDVAKNLNWPRSLSGVPPLPWYL